MENQDRLPIRVMARVLKVSASGFYAWQGRAPGQRALANEALTEQIRQAHADSHGSYGMPRIRAELREHGVRAGRERIGRLMRQAGIRGACQRRFVVTTERDARQRPAPDLVQRQFAADGPNQLWVSDATYVPTWAGFIYLAIVLDVWSRRVVGWAIRETLHTELMLAALNMALEQRRPVAGVIHHSDQGSQYTSIAFGARCKAMGVRPSMGSVGDAYDNAMAESFFASLERELLNRERFRSKVQARMAVFSWIEGWYNPRRRHSALGQRSPVRFEEEESQKNAIRGTKSEACNASVTCFSSVEVNQEPTQG